MKATRLLVVMLASALALCASQEADAQFGKLAKKIKDKATNAVESKVINESSKAIDNAVDNTTDKVKKKGKKASNDADFEVSDNSSTSSKASKSAKKSGKGPSAEAKAQDPKATDNTVLDGYTKSIAELHAAYETLDPKFFPLQPYYQFKNMYVMDDESNDAQQIAAWKKVMKKVLVAGFENYYNLLKDCDEHMLNGNKVYTPSNDAFEGPFCARYMADPQSIAAFEYFAMSHILHIPRLWMYIEFKLENENLGVIDSSKGMFLPTPRFMSDMISRDVACLDLATSKLPLKDLCEYATNIYNKYQNETDPLNKILYGFMYLGVTNDVIAKHENYSANDNNARMAMVNTERVNKEVWAAAGDFSVENTEPQPLPKGVSVPAEMKQKGIAAGKQFAKEKFSKVIHLSSQWSPIKSKKWPYNIVMYSTPIMLVTVENGKEYMTSCVLRKSTSGVLSIMTDIGSQKVPVKK